MRLALLLPLVLAQPTVPTRALDLPLPIAKVLDGGAWDHGIPLAFRVIALSQVADACAEQAKVPELQAAARRCVAKTVVAARAVVDPEATNDALYLTHDALILGAADRVGACPDPQLHGRLVRRLAALSLADPTAHAASYVSTSLRWPADQSATLAALHRYDLAHHATVTDAPLARWRKELRHKLDVRGLPRSEVTGRGPGATVARGCAQSWISRYLPEVDPAQSQAWWVVYRKHFEAQRGPFVGFREWPVGVEGPTDMDSGPIIAGVGAAASAFGVAAARAQGDEVFAAQLQAGEDVLLATGAGGAAAHSVLAEAIRLAGRWQPRLVELQ